MANNTEPGLTSLSKIMNDLDASQQNAVLPVPADLLASLAASVKDLNDSVSQLRSDNDRLQQELSSVKSELMTLQQNVGARFPQFPRLPFELRQYVTL
jgi:peptidoglycan hydrolase CwlO-like protein